MHITDFELYVGFELPNKIKYIDPRGPPRTHWAFLRNDRTKKLLLYAGEKRVHQPGPQDVRNKFHAEQELLAIIERNRHKLTTSEWRGSKTIISARFSKCGLVGNSKFCCSCARLILNKCRTFVKNVMYYENGKMYKEPIENICNNATYSTSLIFRKGLTLTTV